MKWMSTNLILLPAITVSLIAGCRSYEPKPIDWKSEVCTGMSNELHIATLEDASVVALIGNRELNTLRLKAANSSRIAQETGWWADPELDFDIMRIVNPGDNPFLGGGSIAFTVPLSGALALDEKVATAYAEADAANIRASEMDVAAEARKLAIRLHALRKRCAMLQKWRTDERAESARLNVEKLHESGEVTSSELASVRRRIHSLRHEIMESEKEISATEIAFLRLAGLHPGTKIHVELDQPEKIALPDANDDPLDLVKHPKVVAALMRLGGTEHALHAEIRRQYPDLKLGPAYVNEEGLDRFGLVAGISIPLWNRNRKGIAEAEGARDEARQAAIDAWRSLVCDAAEARTNLIRLLQHPPVPTSEREHADRLADAGELTPLEYLNVREEIMEFDLAHADWRRDVALTAAELEKFNVNR